MTTITLIRPDAGPARKVAEGDSLQADAQPVRHLNIDAALGGWGDTVEADGLIVYVQPVDAYGRAAAVHGTLEVDLTGMHLNVPRPGQPFEKLAHGRRPCGQTISARAGRWSTCRFRQSIRSAIRALQRRAWSTPG